MSVSSPGRDLFTYSGGWHELGNLSCQVVPRSWASLLRDRTMGWAFSLLSLRSCAHLTRLLHLSVPNGESLFPANSSLPPLWQLLICFSLEKASLQLRPAAQTPLGSQNARISCRWVVHSSENAFLMQTHTYTLTNRQTHCSHRQTHTLQNIHTPHHLHTHTHTHTHTLTDTPHTEADIHTTKQTHYTLTHNHRQVDI